MDHGIFKLTCACNFARSRSFCLEDVAEYLAAALGKASTPKVGFGRHTGMLGHNSLDATFKHQVTAMQYLLLYIRIPRCINTSVRVQTTGVLWVRRHM
jgi:hypothetical protein